MLKFGGIIFAVRVVKNPLIGDGGKWHECIILERLPGAQSFLDLLGKHGRIARCFESFLRHLAGNLVIAVAVRAASDENGSDDERASHANDAHSIGEGLIVPPLLERLFFCLGKAVVAHSRKELLHSVVTIRREQFFRAHQPKRVKVVRRHDVGATFATIERQQSNAHALPARFIGQHSAVFVVGMRSDHQEACARVEFQKALPECRRSSIEIQRLRGRQ